VLTLFAVGVLAWYLVVLFTWATRPLHDTVPIGIDYTATSPRMAYQEVRCNTLFGSSPLDGEPPALRVQMTNGVPATATSPAAPPGPLDSAHQFAYQRPPCGLVQHDARIVFVIDTLGALLLGGGALFMAARRVGEPEPAVGEPKLVPA
jgi:hypothetical protein